MSRQTACHASQALRPSRVGAAPGDGRKRTFRPLILGVLRLNRPYRLVSRLV